MEQQQSQQPVSTYQAPAAGGDTYSYRGWLNSDRFLKRAIAIFGYSICGQFIFIIPLFIIGLILSV